jgi:Carboxypeptidase regulatory-like domain
MKFCLYVLIALFSSSIVFGQSVTLRGLITDESGAIVPGATIVVTNGSGSTTNTVSANDGSYSAALPPGDFSVQASAPSLKSAAVKVSIRSGVQSLDLQMKVATVGQEVTVEDRAVAVTPEPANNAGATVLGQDELQALSDNPEDLIAELMAIAGPSAGLGGASLFIDGFADGQVPSKEAIREIHINQNPFSPEYDKIGTGRIEILTKPGTNQFHGTEGFNISNDVWNSRNPYGQQKAPFFLKEYIGNVSGPIGNRASFFVDLRRDAIDNGAIINGSTIDPSTLNIIDPFTEVFLIAQRRWTINPRADFQLTRNNTLSVRWNATHTIIPSSGVGGFNLISRGASSMSMNHTAQVTDTTVLSENIVNEVRLQIYHPHYEISPTSTGYALQVLGAFNGGASSVGKASDTQRHLEFQDYVTALHGKHSWRFGVRIHRPSDDNVAPQNFAGTFTFGGGSAPILDTNNKPVLDSTGQPVLGPITSIERYRRTLLFKSLGFSPIQIASLGGGATQFTLVTGDPHLSASEFDIGLFAGDDWKVNPNLTLSLGFRYEAQTNIHDPHDFAPRMAIAWAVRPKTVIRAGAGIFYDRFSLGNTMTALRQNGIRQQQFAIANPDFFPSIPSIASLAGFQTAQIRQQVSPTLVAPRFYQAAIAVERQLPWNTTLAVTYTTSHGLHMLRSRDANAPLAGTYEPAVAGSGVFPLGPVGSVFLMESSGLYNQNQLSVNVNSRANKYVSLTGSYTLNHAMSNTDGIGTFPANPYSLVGEYGPAATDVRHRMSLGGSINTKWNVAFNPLLNVASGPPFDITVGRDIYGTTLFNGRPGIATDPSKPGVIPTSYGLLDPNPTSDETILHRNYGRGPGTVSVNLRVTKTFTLGPKPDGNDKRPYTLSFAMASRNLLNHTNPGPIIGNITSPLFGHANQPSGGGGNGGFSEAANNRTLEFQTRFTF